jgi:alpha-ketoglutarate-dependent taurine dioxygenase
MRMHLIDSSAFDNAAAGYRHIEALPLAAAMGAEIRGVQVADLDDDAFDELRHALFRHKMIFLRDQDVEHADQEAFTLRFGEFGEDAYTVGVPGHEHVQPVVKEADDKVGMIFGTGWHTDSAFLERPPAISMLYAREVPPYGGDTIWANAALAHRLLSPRMREIIDGLRVHMSRRDVMETSARAGSASATITMRDDDEEAARHLAGTTHPLVRTHPDTGERSLYVDETYTCGIEGLTDAEATPLLGFLVGHVTRSAFTCRLRWAPRTLAVWDNRLGVHQAYNDHDGFRREMYRTTVRGERPV